MSVYFFERTFVTSESFLPFFFFLIALFYSSIGFGGGSSYLAILGVFLTEFHEIRTTALILNITVVSIGTVVFIKQRTFSWKLFWPFLIGSVPMAYLGAQFKLSETVFFLLLGSLLIISGVLLFAKFLQSTYNPRKFSQVKKIAIGGAIGFLAGFSGIGGGIFLSPFLNMMEWRTPRVIASLASVFIFSNSLAGIAGLYFSNSLSISSERLLLLILAVGLGGLLGSFLSVKKLGLKSIGLLTATLVLYVGVRLLLLHGFDISI
ncbi:MAG: sulfite exporter TauE/SafE family protein [Bacteroidota bacterium]